VWTLLERKQGSHRPTPHTALFDILRLRENSSPAGDLVFLRCIAQIRAPCSPAVKRKMTTKTNTGITGSPSRRSWPGAGRTTFGEQEPECAWADTKTRWSTRGDRTAWSHARPPTDARREAAHFVSVSSSCGGKGIRLMIDGRRRSPSLITSSFFSWQR
jgi:hypothetical protein